ncbi:MAG: coenzyme F420 hydrogenase subunit alpha, partial [Methanofollis sp.]|nr:coenzyme F420 hydrogenase subunit alpha [Methanofollis sp.]
NPFTPEEPVRSVALRIQKLREVGQTVGEIVGGEAIHPSNPRVGGMYNNITPRAKEKIYDLAKEALPLAREQMEFMISVFKNFQNRDTVEVGGMEVPVPDTFGFHNQGYMATAPVYGSSSLDDDPTWFPERWTEVRPWDWYMGETEIDYEEPNYPIGGTTPAGNKAWPQMEACMGVPLYDGQPVEVGPRARMVQYRNFDQKGAMGLQIARQMEYMDCIYGMMEAADALNTSGKVLADEIPQGDGTLGWASNEAPRGSDVHLVKVKDGRVRWYSLLVPTTWNFPTCSRALEGAPWQLAEVIVRAYDPCVSCATHMLVVNEDKRIVAQKLIE